MKLFSYILISLLLATVSGAIIYETIGFPEELINSNTLFIKKSISSFPNIIVFFLRAVIEDLTFIFIPLTLIGFYKIFIKRKFNYQIETKPTAIIFSLSLLFASLHITNPLATIPYLIPLFLGNLLHIKLWIENGAILGINFHIWNNFIITTILILGGTI